MLNNTCIDPAPTYSACPYGIRFLAMCVSTCPRDFIKKGPHYESESEFVCYIECPRWLGWATIADAGQETNYSVDYCRLCADKYEEDPYAEGSSCTS